ncbi:ATP-binding protein [Advenella alkanexedens]|uniref:ATP-binding protein n=1 Tax=Advenella alkanexedens TaxID=1481665 RepID=A0ABS6NLJ3_9BURK|nr:AAA family ATPase [Advenella alkanexedens]MBV4396122.1 ATP-binding protein [Advenella alkanexedens]
MSYFHVLPVGKNPPVQASNCAYLLTDNWDDWFKFSTLYTLVIYDETGERHNIGGVKIGQFAMTEKQHRPNLPEQFDNLDDRFFSLGQDDSYYDFLNNLGAGVRDRILGALRDVALDSNLFERALNEQVTGTSLLRSVDRSTVTGQFHRMAQGGARLTNYKFSYSAQRRSPFVEPLSLTFFVAPESYPPTNVHVLIGRNGVGKTTLLNDMTRAIVNQNTDATIVGAFSFELGDFDENLFTSLVSVTFSAFDPFEPPPDQQDKSQGVRYAYIGLKNSEKDKNGQSKPPKNPDALSVDFVNSVLICRQSGKVARWERALNMLQADPIFRDAGVSSLARSTSGLQEIKTEARRLFKNLSSGHKIVLLTITRLIETVEEKTLVLLDEPEAHLHPPLLSAFVRALSDLLINRNGVALIATHSPVVLQEVPMSCVWMIRRTGLLSIAERPEIQTFGENIGLLTREVFGLEVTQSGFHKMLRDAVSELPNYDRVVRHFSGELGDEARAIIQGLLAARENLEDEDF